MISYVVLKSGLTKDHVGTKHFFEICRESSNLLRKRNI